MKRFIISILLIFISLTSFSQIKVKEGSFRRIVNYVMDDKDEHIDGNYMPMALIKISTENINAEERNKLYFKGNRATDFHVEPKIGELYLYISAEAATVLEIKHPDYGKTVFTFPEPLCDFCAYELVVQYIPIAPTPSDHDMVMQKQYLIVKADKPDALIYIDDVYVDKLFVHKQFDVGTTHTWRIECDLFRTESGTISITEEENVVEVKMLPEYGFINVSTTPENGARVFIDDSLVGTTPYKSDKMSVGTYTVKVMKDDYKVKEDKVLVKDKETTEARIQMLSVFVDVALNADSGSDIYVDDVYKGRGRWSGKLREGTYIVEARKENHRTVRKNLELIAGNSETMSLGSPEPIYGSLNIASTPTGATVFIDGKQYGQTPYYVTEILIGNHELRLEKEGCATLIKTITLKEGNTNKLNETLQTGKEITISTDRNGDKIYVDDKYIGLSPMTVNLAYGTYHIKAERGRQTTSKTIDVKVGNTAEECLLVFGKIVRITSFASGDDIYVDGKKVGQTPMDIDFSFGKHFVEVRRGRLYDSGTIDISRDNLSSYYFIPKKGPLYKYLENGVNFITLNGAYSVATQTSFGITYGQVRKVGWFVSAMSNFDFTGFNVTDKPFDEVALTGKTKNTRISVMGGFIVRIGGPVYAKVGAGYGLRVRVCETISGDYVEYAGNTYKGIDASAGLLFNLRNFSFAFDAVTTNFKTLEFKLGIGINWKKR